MSTLVIEKHDAQENERRERAALTVTKHVQRHGLGLHEVVEMARDETALNSVGDLISDCDTAFPDPERIADSLATIQTCLEELSFEQVERWSLSHEVPRDPFAAHAWHGAKVADFLRTF